MMNEKQKNIKSADGIKFGKDDLEKTYKIAIRFT